MTETEKICTMPGCSRQQKYPTLELCRPCYKRVRHIARSRGMNLEIAKSKLATVERLAIDLGIKPTDSSSRAE